MTRIPSLSSMPRPKVTEELRRRVAKACLRCQESKHKCDGLTPCAQCMKRGQGGDCNYSPIERSYGRHRRRRVSRRPEMSSERDTILRQPDKEASPNSSRLSESPQPSGLLQTAGEQDLPRKKPGKLYDTRGRIVYLGECAASAFLQHLQGFLESDSRLSTTEQPGFSKLTAIEEMPLQEERASPPGGPGNIGDLQDLIKAFFASTCGILDIIDRPQVDGWLHNWRDGKVVDSGRIAVLFLILACGAQSRSSSSTDTQYSQYYYHEGRQLALLELTDEPRVETVQAFVLISFYMLSSSQRNGAFLNLGTAISAAKSLGFHRDDVNDMLGEGNGHLRPRIWRSLRYHDLFFWAMMGRTPSTMTTDSYYTDESIQRENSSTPKPGQHLALAESMRAFSIMECAIPEAYTKQTTSLARLASFARELQAATSEIPRELRTVSALDGPEQRQHVIRNAHVACSYYFGMMMLTRPFLMSCIQQRCHRASDVLTAEALLKSQLEEKNISTEAGQGALAAMDSSVHVIRLIHELLKTGMLYNSMVLIIAMVFVASLTLCSSYLGRLGSPASTEQAIRQAEAILGHFAVHTRQGKRYGYILSRFYKAARLHREAVERRATVAPVLEMPELFSLSASGVMIEPRDNDRLPQEKQKEVSRQQVSGQERAGFLGVAEDTQTTDRDQPQLSSNFNSTDGTISREMDWQETLLLTSAESSINDIIESFTEVGRLAGVDGSLTSGSHRYSPLQNCDFSWEFG